VIAFQRDKNLRSSGHVSKNVQVAIIDMNTKQIAGVNVCGEIWCKTPHIHAPRELQRNNPNMDDKFNGSFIYIDIYVLHFCLISFIIKIIRATSKI